jgi:hypothetical protein
MLSDTFSVPRSHVSCRKVEPQNSTIASSAISEDTRYEVDLAFLRCSECRTDDMLVVSCGCAFNSQSSLLQLQVTEFDFLQNDSIALSRLRPCKPSYPLTTR